MTKSNVKISAVGVITAANIANTTVYYLANGSAEIVTKVYYLLPSIHNLLYSHYYISSHNCVDKRLYSQYNQSNKKYKLLHN